MDRESRLLCPYCLQPDTGLTAMDYDEHPVFTCNHCNTRLPPEYIAADMPEEIVAAVGPAGHGKSTYFASLFQTLNTLAGFWNGFYSFAVDEKSLNMMREGTRRLEAGELPPLTAPNSPEPVLLRLSNMPYWGNRIFMFYDTSGHSFSSAYLVMKNAGFVRMAHTALFFLSLDELRDPLEMHDLLSVYVQGAAELRAALNQQHLVVVFTKADRLKPRLVDFPDIWEYLVEGSTEKLRQVDMLTYLNEMQQVSTRLLLFLKESVGASQFLNFAGSRFKSINFSIVSAIGWQPTSSKLELKTTPKRIMDPLFWLMHNSILDNQSQETGRKEKHEWLQIFNGKLGKGKRRVHQPTS